MAARTYTVERRTTVEAPAAAAYERVVDLHRWEAWSPWEGMDPDQSRTYEGPDRGVGASYAWAGNRKVGEGRMEIVEAEPDRRVRIDLRFLKPFRSRSETVIELEPAGDRTEVVWRMVGPQTLVTRVMGIFKPMDAMIGPDFEKGLEQLKAEAEREA